MTGHNLPEPCYGIGANALISRWIDRESAQIAAGMTDAARQTKMMRREMQEALDLVADPEKILKRPLPGNDLPQ